MTIHYSKVTSADLLANKYILSDIEILTKDDMPVRFARGFKTLIPSWYAFVLVYLSGSGKKSIKYLNNMGVLTTEGKSFHVSTILFCMWNWVIHHVEEAKPFFIEEENRRSDQEYYDLVILKVSKITKFEMSDENLIEWLINNNFNSERYLEKIKERRPEVYRHFKTLHPELIQK
jgi:hypothetical protein